MDTKFINNPNPRESASLISVLIWWWTMDIFKKGYRKILGPEDLYNPLKKDKSKLLGDSLEKQWIIQENNAKRDNRSPNLLKAIFHTFYLEYLFIGCILVFNELVLRLGTPILLGGLLQYFKAESTTSYKMALIYAGGIALTTVINTISANQYLYNTARVSGRIRIALSSLIYRKALRLSKTALGEMTPGKIVNLVANDVNRFNLVSLFINYMWTSPLSALIIAYFLYHKTGYAGLIGMIPVLIVVPIQIFTGKLSSKFREQTMIKSDERVRLMNEIISGIQVIKMYAWEKPFCTLIEQARRLELKVVKKNSYIRGIYMTFYLFTNRVALYCTLVTMLILDEKLSADNVFVFYTYFNILSHTMTVMFIRGYSEIIECLVTIKRLQGFLTLEEFQEDNVINFNENAYYNQNINDEKKNNKELYKNNFLENYSFTGDIYSHYSKLNNHVENEALAIKLDNVTTKWNQKTPKPILEDFNLEIEKGKLYIVIGVVGSGKSSFLSTILGEMKLLNGKVKVKGNISYAAQESWIFGTSVRQNILFGQEYDKEKYYEVIKACALLEDFDNFSNGDKTIVGERGNLLSGGQKARINLARAIYREADIYLLDDPLSAVDTLIGKHLFQECLQKYLNNKTRILATHQLQYLKYADFIIFMEQGKIFQYKDYRELVNYHPQYGNLIIEKEIESNSINSAKNCNNKDVLSSNMKRQISERDNVKNTEKGKVEDNAKKLTDVIERRSDNAVKGNFLLKYFQIGSNFLLIFVIILLFALTQLMVSFNDYFVSVLVTVEESRYFYKNREINTKFNVSINKNITIIDEQNILPINYYIYIYTGIVLSIFIIGNIRSFAFYTICARNNQRLHDIVFGALVRTNLRFFNTNPSGRILNRFSKDMSAIDELFPKAILDAGQNILLMCSSLIIPCIVNPFFLVPIGIIGTMCYWLRLIYMKASKNIKRLEGTTRSPVFTHFNISLNGLSTIRAYRAQKALRNEFDKIQDFHTSSWYMFTATSVAFSFLLDLCGFILMTLITFTFLFLKENFSGGEVGLSITQIMAVMGAVQWTMRQTAEVEIQLTAVERVLEYKELPPESKLDKKETRKEKKEIISKQRDSLIQIPKNWPINGNIEFKNVFMRYDDKDLPVLKDLNVEIQDCEKIGIVGRTGAGKSSLISAIFRLAKVEGVIKIDGIDINTIDLDDLRKHISIIPQDPVLFSGTLRYNLDPFNKFSDNLLWEALEVVELKDLLITTDNVLDNQVHNQGANFSVGQRQLICLARAILRNDRILILDEATANVDPHTDALIQRTIRTKFAPCTVLTIAHRLSTIMDSDKVLVMDSGRLVEYDHPHILLQNESGYFTILVKETGDAINEKLCKIAQNAYLAKFE